MLHWRQQRRERKKLLAEVEEMESSWKEQRIALEEELAHKVRTRARPALRGDVSGLATNMSSFCIALLTIVPSAVVS